MSVPQSDVVHVELDPAVVLAAYAQHRRRFVDEVSSLDAAALAERSRCAKWSVADVLRHCADVDEWMQAIWNGRPLPFKTFDPNTTPHECVLIGRSLSDLEARDRYVTSTAEMAGDIDQSEPDRWGLPAFSPLGAVPWWLSVLHVFWDSWLHERDALLPIEVSPPEVPDEVASVATYTVALAGTIVPEPGVEVVAGVRVITGQRPVVVTPVEPEAGAIDGLSGRAPLEGFDERWTRLAQLLDSEPK